MRPEAHIRGKAGENPGEDAEDQKWIARPGPVKEKKSRKKQGKDQGAEKEKPGGAAKFENGRVKNFRKPLVIGPRKILRRVRVAVGPFQRPRPEVFDPEF